MSTFLLPGVPGPQCRPEELADFWEIQCLRSKAGHAPLSLIRHAWEQRQEEDASEDMDEDIAAEASYEDAREEIAGRAELLGAEYPFALADGRATTLALRDTSRDLYLFLLLATRLANRVIKGIDAKALFERVSAEILASYLGKDARFTQMGASTGDTGTFEGRLRSLCEIVGEFRVRPDFKSHSQAGDRGLDCVAWKPFADSRPGSLMIWGQAKTGVGWRKELQQLHPPSFIQNWLHPGPCVPPVRAFLVTERAEAGRWDEFQTTAGLFLDRCRLMQFEADLPKSVSRKVSTWVSSAVKQLDAL